MPAINRPFSWDERKMTILEGTRNDKYRSIRNNETLFFDDFFQSSPCVGTLAADKKSVKFNNIFNNQQCKPDCRTVFEDETMTEQCE